jgi:hypothetical protein
VRGDFVENEMKCVVVFGNCIELRGDFVERELKCKVIL